MLKYTCKTLKFQVYVDPTVLDLEIFENFLNFVLFFGLTCRAATTQ